MPTLIRQRKVISPYATLDRITTRKQVAPKRTAKAFNPLARDETQIFRALLDGQHIIRGFSNPDIRQKLQDSPHLCIALKKKQEASRTEPKIFDGCLELEDNRLNNGTIDLASPLITGPGSDVLRESGNASPEEYFAPSRKLKCLAMPSQKKNLRLGWAVRLCS